MHRLTRLSHDRKEWGIFISRKKIFYEIKLHHVLDIANMQLYGQKWRNIFFSQIELYHTLGIVIWRHCLNNQEKV